MSTEVSSAMESFLQVALKAGHNYEEIIQMVTCKYKDLVGKPTQEKEIPPTSYVPLAIVKGNLDGGFESAIWNAFTMVKDIHLFALQFNDGKTMVDKDVAISLSIASHKVVLEEEKAALKLKNRVLYRLPEYFNAVDFVFADTNKLVMIQVSNQTFTRHENRADREEGKTALSTKTIKLDGETPLQWICSRLKGTHRSVYYVYLTDNICGKPNANTRKKNDELRC